ncbi:4218_t:CDS:2 [Entrophospora sp. SA101]|nr:4218_t:CDS:2 [Entrophospora sp. SA101]
MSSMSSVRSGMSSNYQSNEAWSRGKPELLKGHLALHCSAVPTNVKLEYMQILIEQFSSSNKIQKINSSHNVNFDAIFSEELLEKTTVPDKVNNLSDSDESEIEPEPCISYIEATKILETLFCFWSNKMMNLELQIKIYRLFMEFFENTTE